MLHRAKALAYITSQPAGSHMARLLVFEHVGIPAAGVQVPAGTIEPGETPAAAALREGFEGLRLGALLGVVHRDMREFGLDEIHVRHCFHLVYDGSRSNVWFHEERHASDGGGSYRFRCFWTPLPNGIPPLVGGQDELLPRLIERLELARKAVEQRR